MKARVAWVTGGSRGIGNAIAETLIAQGYRVAVGYHAHRAPAEKLAAGRDTVMAVEVDVSSTESVARAVGEIDKTLGSVEILVNNAGIAQTKPFMDISDLDWEHMLSVNFLGAVRCSRAVIPSMVTKGFGRIINISSVGGQWGGVYQVHYAASKAALINFTKSLAKLYSHAGVCSNAVAPGLIETDMIKSEMSDADAQKRVEGIPSGRIGASAEVASAVAYLCSNEAGYITGQTINVNGGMYLG